MGKPLDTSRRKSPSPEHGREMIGREARERSIGRPGLPAPAGAELENRQPDAEDGVSGERAGAGGGAPEKAGSLPRTGILGEISLGGAPFHGEIFESHHLVRGRDLFRSGGVRLVTANVQGAFAGIFGQVDDPGRGGQAEVSIVINRARDGGWSLDGRSDLRGERNNEHVAALLMAAMRANGAAADDGFGLAEIRPALHLFTADVRAGILHWDDAEAMSVLRDLRLARVQDAGGGIEARLREMGLKPLAEIHPWDEIDAGCRHCFACPSDRRSAQELFWADFLSNKRGELAALGCDITVEEGFGLQVVEASDWYGELEEDDQGVDWFAFECGIRVGGERVNILPCLVRYLEGRPDGFSPSDFDTLPPGKKIPVQLEDPGSFVAVPAERLRSIFEILTELFHGETVDEEGRLVLHRVRAAQLTRQQGESALVDKAPAPLLVQAQELEKLKPRADPHAPREFLATLRPYQQDGFEWLQFLREQGLGGILADDMGLGKTIQTLCHLHAEKESGRADRPCLIVAPKSVVPNWEKEAKKFAPSLRVLTLQGPGRKKYYPVMAYSDLVLTSYPILLRDADELFGQPFHYIVLDEAHTIKNSSSGIAKVACRVDARHRLCLTGTPIENHLGELWSQFHFLMPGFLGSEDSFARCFRVPIEKHRDEGLRKRLADRVAPLMLRRTKALVAKDLPEKTEIVRSLELTPKQIEIYEAVRAAVSREVREEIQRRGEEASRILVLDALLKLRQVCCHPRLLRLPSAQRARGSAKLDWLMERLPVMVEEGRRVLVFSQFTRMLDLIETELDKKKVRYQTLTGQSKDRGALCDNFQSGRVPVFLISLRAGGTGLNLTAADTVIHFDPWWNPALESQATDRAYRIGQKNPVFVYKLISEGTIEEKILLLQEKKRALYEGILEGAPQKLAFSEEELDDLLAPIG